MSKKVDEIKLKRDFSGQVIDVYGKPVFSGATESSLAQAIARFFKEAPADARKLFNDILEQEQQKPLTLGIAAAEALAGAYEGERDMGFEERDKRYQLARRVVGGGLIEITPAERDKIKSLLPRRFGGSVIAPSCGELLETEPPAPPLEESQTSSE